MTTVAITRTNSIDATTAPAVALTEGFQAAFLACTVIAAIGILAGDSASKVPLLNLATIH